MLLSINNERSATSVADGAAPALDTVLRRALALDFETRAAVCQQQKSCGAGNEVTASAPDCFGGPLCKAVFQEEGQFVRAANDRAVLTRAKQIVPDPVAFGQAWLAGEIGLWIEHIDRRDCRGVCNIELSAGEVLIEEPGAARDAAGRGRFNELFEGCQRHCIEGAL